MAIITEKSRVQWGVINPGGTEIDIKAANPIDVGQKFVLSRGKFHFSQMMRISFSPRLELKGQEVNKLLEYLHIAAQCGELPRPQVRIEDGLQIFWPGIRFRDVNLIAILLMGSPLELVRSEVNLLGIDERLLYLG